MLNNITEDKAIIWNNRLESKMKELKWSQRKFAEKYKEKYKTGSQADVNKWLHVGEIYGKDKIKRGFPAFETMRNIAELLDVSVGYLIGETDYENFDIEKAVKFLHLPPKAINGIKDITTGKAIPPFYHTPDPQITGALVNLLTNKYFVEYLSSMCDFAELIDNKDKPLTIFEDAANKIPENIRDDVFSLFDDEEEAIASGIKPTELMWKYVSDLHGAAYSEVIEPDIIKERINAAKYAIEEVNIKIRDEMIKPENIKILLPHYATKEELEALIRHIM